MLQYCLTTAVPLDLFFVREELSGLDDSWEEDKKFIFKMVKGVLSLDSKGLVGHSTVMIYGPDNDEGALK